MYGLEEVDGKLEGNSEEGGGMGDRGREKGPGYTTQAAER